MKKLITAILIVTLLLSIGLIVAFALTPKHEIPTDAEWEAYLSWEQEFLEWRDTEAITETVYQIQHKDTHEVYFYGSLKECKDILNNYTDCTIMPYAK